MNPKCLRYLLQRVAVHVVGVADQAVTILFGGLGVRRENIGNGRTPHMALRSGYSMRKGLAMVEL